MKHTWYGSIPSSQSVHSEVFDEKGMPSHFGFMNPDFIDDHIYQLTPNGSFDHILRSITLTERGVHIVVHPTDGLGLLGDTVRNFHPEFPLNPQHEFNGIEAHFS